MIPLAILILLIGTLLLTIVLIIIMEGVYMPKKAFLKKENNELFCIVKCIINTWTIPVDEIELKRIGEVATIRLFGVGIPGVISHGIFSGPYGRVTAIAKTREGLFIRSKDGKLYFIGVPEAKEIYSQYLQERGEFEVP